ncbi:MAG: YitT family protein [Anaerovibrio sp.]|nr:YitT family protein [Anaerovibrio sp.]
MFRRKTLQHELLHYGGITIGCLIASCSINLFLVPSHLLTGGATGIAIIFYYLAAMPIGIQTLVYNVPLLLAAWKLMGRSYTLDIIVGTTIFSVCLDMTGFLNAYAPVDDVMLAAIFGGVFNGIGYGIVFRRDGSTGGFDIVGAIVKKYYSLHMGGVIFGFNCLIMLIAAFLFGVKPAMFTLISMFINAMVTDKVIAGFNSRKAVLIVSDKAEAIADGILMEIGRGVTFLHGQGAFTHNERNVVFVAVTLFQVGKIKMIANEIDANAFMIIMSANEVMGRGFTKPGAPLPLSDGGGSKAMHCCDERQ